ncbi:MAG: hypothetical protein OXU70_10560 [Gammaproteobacteria bacterium]|nr:hypothetical protein [Gammaproteobacteria bacterium]
MFSNGEVAQFGWELVCRAVKDAAASEERESATAGWQAYLIVNRLGKDPDGQPIPHEVVTAALKRLERQGAPVRGYGGGYWLYDRDRDG